MRKKTRKTIKVLVLLAVATLQALLGKALLWFGTLFRACGSLVRALGYVVLLDVRMARQELKFWRD